VKRGLAGLLALAVVAALAFAWWPHGDRYRPIQPWEGGTLRQVAAALPQAARPASLVAGDSGSFLTAWPRGDARPTAAHPQLALVLIPRDGSGTASGTGTSTGAGGSGNPSSWVFPFNKPLDPGPGDNQALAVNTKDNTVQYDVAFALVWIDDDSPAYNTNEAYAFASCKNCAAVAVGFQVVLVTGHNHVAVPQNLAGAVNYNCVNCLTYALAQQLFLTLDGPLSDAGMQKLAAIWQQIGQFGAHITEVPLSEIQSRLTDYEQQIRTVIEQEQGPLSGQPTATPSAGSSQAGALSSAGPSAGPSGAATPGGTTTGTGTGSDGSTSSSDNTGGTGATTAPTGGGGTTTSGSGGSGSGTTPAPSSAPSPDTAQESPAASSAP
jgi:putative peptide zinc metalloprotease protein